MPAWGEIDSLENVSVDDRFYKDSVILKSVCWYVIKGSFFFLFFFWRNVSWFKIINFFKEILERLRLTVCALKKLNVFEKKISSAPVKKKTNKQQQKNTYTIVLLNFTSLLVFYYYYLFAYLL